MRPTICIPCALAMLLTVTGCYTNKQNWSDWVTHPNQVSELTLPTPAAPTNGPLTLSPGYDIGDGAHVDRGFDLKMRNPDFPNTHIEAVYIDLSSPTNGVHVKWVGKLADIAPTGPWRLTPGRGTNGFNCDDVIQSNTEGSLCTPKGVFKVAGFDDHLEDTPYCLYATWVVHRPRYIAIHSHTELPTVPASSGCIRMPYATAKLIHNNSIAGVTLVSISGTWHRPPPTNQFSVRR